MSFFEEVLPALQAPPDTPVELTYPKGCYAPPHGPKYEERTLVLLFLRCESRKLRFLLSSTDDTLLPLDDVVLRYSSDGGQQASALLGQLKHRVSRKRSTIARGSFLAEKDDFSIMKYYQCYKRLKARLGSGQFPFALVLSTNAKFAADAEDMFLYQSKDNIPWVELLDTGGTLRKLNSGNADVRRVTGEVAEPGFMENFFIFFEQAHCEALVHPICSELTRLLGPIDNCEDLCKKLWEDMRTWMDDIVILAQKKDGTEKHGNYLHNSWEAWKNVCNGHIRRVTECNSMVTTLRYKSSSVVTLKEHLEQFNPAWVKTPGRGTSALTLTKVHQVISAEQHVMLRVEQLNSLKEKVLVPWGRSFRWLVLLDDSAEHNYDDLADVTSQVDQDRRLVVVSLSEHNSFVDTLTSSDICDESWRDLLDVAVRPNCDQRLCRLRDLACDVDALQTLVDGRFDDLVALCKLSEPLEVGRELAPLPEIHITRQLASRSHLKEDFFHSLGEKEVCITDENSYQLLKNKISMHTDTNFKDIERYLVASVDTSWPIFAHADRIDVTFIRRICEEHRDIRFYIVCNSGGSWQLLFLHGGWEKVSFYSTEKDKDLLEVMRGTSDCVIIEGKPGVGKTTVVSDIAVQLRNYDCTWLIVRIDFKKFYKVLNSGEDVKTTVERMLLHSLSEGKKAGGLEHRLLQHCLKRYANVACLMDGFDEICPDYANTCLQVLRQLVPGQGKLVVTTRPTATSQLEDELGVLAHSLEPFTRDQALEFLGRSGVAIVLPKLVIVHPQVGVQNLLTIPQYASMFVKASRDGTEIRDVVSLYETFFEKEFDRFYEEKWGDDLSAPGKKNDVEKSRREVEKQLMYLAASLLVRKTDVLEQIDAVELDIDVVIRAGIVFQNNEKALEFVHRTFAEYFLAKWCITNIETSHCEETYREAVGYGTMELFVEAFDRMAVRGQPLLTTIMNRDDIEVITLLRDTGEPVEVDTVGRNALHVAAAYGFGAVVLGLLCHLLGEAALRVEDRLLRWTPLRYAAERRHWRSVAALLWDGASLDQLQGFQEGLYECVDITRMCDSSSFRDLFPFILYTNNSARGAAMVELSWLFRDRFSLEIEVGVSLACAHLPDELLERMAQKAYEEDYEELSKILWQKLAENEKRKKARRVTTNVMLGRSSVGQK